MKQQDPPDEERFRRIYFAHYARVLAFVLRRVPENFAAQDIVAETFTTAWRRLDDLPGPDNACLLWLLGVARRTILNQHRSERRRTRLVTKLAEEAGRKDTPVAPAALDDVDVAALRAALGRLSPADADILRMSAWDELGHSDLARLLDCSVNAVAIRLHRARKRLRDELAGEHAAMTTTPAGLTEERR
ncbi:sigma-70 family RNA polymerase sigma factor [Frankia sp. AgPm24]|uniref:RNA polymerase sigma factor n=1 Tax=Frankia sp. AgPm24 TaxID=631128 RepID=UPI00200E15DE|nr:sigma-70 family RNA polymerase sigma factor [Frankia sp. AgPm24]MCK9922084.1 sigma-70 family RNA polymerase sigma factor [Frankia sp. AgPm24]